MEGFMSLSDKEQQMLDTCDERLKELFTVVKRTGYPCKVLEGHRNKERQDEAFYKGFSKKKWPDGEHNSWPSKAVDVAPLMPDSSIDWDSKDAPAKFAHFAGIVQGIAFALGYKIRWGGDWNMNWDLKDQKFFDLPHFEIVD